MQNQKHSFFCDICVIEFLVENSENAGIQTYHTEFLDLVLHTLKYSKINRIRSIFWRNRIAHRTLNINNKKTIQTEALTFMDVDLNYSSKKNLLIHHASMCTYERTNSCATYQMYSNRNFQLYLLMSSISHDIQSVEVVFVHTYRKSIFYEKKNDHLNGYVQFWFGLKFAFTNSFGIRRYHQVTIRNLIYRITVTWCLTST